jgi:choline dehydrogenase-like flavoprotein
MVIVVGSGAGGATVAKELALASISVTVIEKGPFIKPKRAFNQYEPSEEGMDLLKTVCVGGSTVVAVGNGVRVLEDELKEYGVDISAELAEVEEELQVDTLPDSHFGKGTKLLMDAAESLDIPIKKMPKFIRSQDCKPCGKCSLGCPKDAKWSARDYVAEAQQAGAELIFNSAVTELVIENGHIKGVKFLKYSEDEMGNENYAPVSEIFLESETVILAPGAVETPRLLQKAGLDAGKNFFMDTFITVGGILKKVKFNKEVQMNALIVMDNFIMGPHFSTFLSQELKDRGAKDKDILGLMVKIADEPSGRVEPEKVIKINTLRDVRYLAEGAAMAGSILSAAGVKPDTIVSTHPRGAHPGGTAAIGEVVDKNLETDIKGLYVADASVLPVPPGAPPILTIIALAKRLAKHIIHENR